MNVGMYLIVFSVWHCFITKKLIKIPNHSALTSGQLGSGRAAWGQAWASHRPARGIQR